MGLSGCGPLLRRKAGVSISDCPGARGLCNPIDVGRLEEPTAQSENLSD